MCLNAFAFYATYLTQIVTNFYFIILVVQGRSKYTSFFSCIKPKPLLQTYFTFSCLKTLITSSSPNSRTLSPTWISVSLLKRISTLAKLTGTLFAPFTSLTFWYFGFSIDPSSFAIVITSEFQLGSDLFYKPSNKISPRWLCSLCARTQKNTNSLFKEWKRHSTALSHCSTKSGSIF